MECREKLVRDRIGEEMEASGRPVRRAEPGEVEELLLDKIVEEALELKGSRDPWEAADLLEALLSWARLRGMSLEDILRLASEKRARRGGFTRYYVALLCREGFQS